MKDEKILLFAGTTEGRLLFERLQRGTTMVDACVATEYGKELLDKNSDRVFAKRLDLDEMKELLSKNHYSLVVDATHPYATVVTQNIKTACAHLNVEYIRLLRSESDCKSAIFCENISQAVEFLAVHEGNVLSTIGSKELEKLTALEGFQKRIFARILPLPQAVDASIALGFEGKNLICMQGPFSYELNVALLKQYDCRYLLTKNSGEVGGFEEKIKAASAANAEVIVIGRPTQEQGLSLDEVTTLLLKEESFQPKREKLLKEFFPLFVNIKSKDVLVVGGGKIAARRSATLAKFDCRIRVVAPELSAELQTLVDCGGFEYHKRCFLSEDLEGAFLVVAATNDREINHTVAILAKQSGIYHSIADCKEECDFFFPAVIQTSDTVIGVTAEGKSHHAAAVMADKIRGLTDEN